MADDLTPIAAADDSDNAGHDPRLLALCDWLNESLGSRWRNIRAASSDASFRRYFRIDAAEGTLIAMDAPPPLEDTGPFVKVAELFRGAGLNVPQIVLADGERGFLLLSDMGSTSYLDALSESTADALYNCALLTLIDLQAAPAIPTQLPNYDATLLRREMDLFRDWFLGKLLGFELSAQDQQLFESVWTALIDSALEQPRVAVHRDYHSRNLMVVSEQRPGVLDFQDAVAGPITYDVVSLLRDCYIEWPEAKISAWLDGYRVAATAAGLLTDVSFDRLQRWFDWMGVQRHLKAVGIFSRLCLRDGKPRYLGDVPRTLGYVLSVAGRYPELAPFADWLTERVAPGLAARLGGLA